MRSGLESFLCIRRYVDLHFNHTLETFSVSLALRTVKNKLGRRRPRKYQSNLLDGNTRNLICTERCPHRNSATFTLSKRALVVARYGEETGSNAHVEFRRQLLEDE